MSWEDEDLDDFGAAPAATAGQWDDEDAEDVCADWEIDSDEEREKKKAEQAAKKKKNTLAEKIRQKELEEAARRKAAILKAAQKQLSKAEQAKVVRKADNRLMSDMFGSDCESDESSDEGESKRGAAGDMTASGPIAVVKKDDNITTAELETKEDYKKFGEVVSKRIMENFSSRNAVEFFEVVLREGLERMTLEDTTTLRQIIQVAHTKKTKERNNKKKKGKKKNLKMSRNTCELFDDIFDEDDF